MLKPDIYPVTELGDGILAVMAKPVSGEWIEDEFKGIAQEGMQQIICLLETHEIYELGLKEEKSLANKNNMDFISFPIADRGVPSDVAEFSQVSHEVYKQIMSGINSVIHCRAGIGRTGLFAAGVLMHGGYEPLMAIKLISEKRRVPVPDTQEQQDWLIHNQQKILAV